jgi:hypothetical protein
MVSARPGAGVVFQHRPCQLSLFPNAAAPPVADASVVPGLDLLDEQRRHEEAWHARQDLLRNVQLRLAAQRLWGFPNMIRNPDGPWQDLRGRAYDIDLSRRCWPAYYLVRVATTGVQRITIHVRLGCDGTPAVPCAAAVVAGLAPVSVVPCTAPYPQYEAS